MSPRSLRTIALAVTFTLGSFPGADAAEYTNVNPSASTISFTYNQMGSKVYGTFGKFVGTLDFDTEHPEAARAKLTIDMLIPNAQGALGWEALDSISARIAELGWVINLQVDGRQLHNYEARLRALPSAVSIDHTGKFLEPVGIDHLGFKSLLSLLDSDKVWVKVSAPYETSKSGPPHYEDVSVLARTLVQAFPERCLWASNWPHPGRSPAPDDLAMLDLLSEWALNDNVRRRILVDNPAELYGFKPV